MAQREEIVGVISSKLCFHSQIPKRGKVIVGVISSKLCSTLKSHTSSTRLINH